MNEREGRRLYRQVFGTAAGERVLSDLLIFAGIVVPYQDDPRYAERLAGRNDVLYYILERLGIVNYIGMDEQYKRIVRALIELKPADLEPDMQEEADT